MKIGLAIAPETASPLAFVVFRDHLEMIMEKVARLGYDGVELALLDADEIKVDVIRKALETYALEVPVVSSGRVFAEGHVWFTHPDKTVRDQAVELMKGLIRLAAQFGAKVNVGRVRGFIAPDESCATAEGRFVECLRECADFAGERQVQMLIEPVNRYETNYINSVPDALAALDQVARPNIAVMPDVFHMNIEDASITGGFRQAGARVGYVHFADSNRRAPGQGHLDFAEIVGVLNDIGYDGYVTAEILPYPDPDTAAANAIEFLRNVIRV
jgi:5-keto-L-gluconate epimerase